jgi:hypothetical protein
MLNHNCDGSNECHIMCVAREYTASANGVQLDGSVIWLVDVDLDDHENKSV